MTFSGGEPLLQRDFVLSLLQSCREKEIHTAVDTSGFVTWDTFERVRPYVDLFLYDLKLMDDDLHQKYTGVSNRLILENLQALSARGHAIILRMAIIPGLNDHPDQIRRAGEFAAALPARHRVSILPYHNTAMDKYERLHQTYQLADIRSPGPERMAHIASILTEYGLQVKTGG